MKSKVMFQLWLIDTAAKVVLSKNNTLSFRTSNSVNQGFLGGGSVGGVVSQLAG
jgi:hypothetical protein